MVLLQKNRTAILQKELTQVEKKLHKLDLAAQNEGKPGWKTALQSKIPPKVYTGLESAFCKGFTLVFEKGKDIIEKTY